MYPLIQKLNEAQNKIDNVVAEGIKRFTTKSFSQRYLNKLGATDLTFEILDAVKSKEIQVRNPDFTWNKIAVKPSFKLSSAEIEKHKRINSQSRGSRFDSKSFLNDGKLNVFFSEHSSSIVVTESFSGFSETSTKITSAEVARLLSKALAHFIAKT